MESHTLSCIQVVNKQQGTDRVTHLGVAVLTFVLGTLARDVATLVAHVAGALRLGAVPGYVAHLGAVVA